MSSYDDDFVERSVFIYENKEGGGVEFKKEVGLIFHNPTTNELRNFSTFAALIPRTLKIEKLIGKNIALRFG